MEVKKEDFKRISDFIWEIPKEFRKKMRVPARIYISEEELENALLDKSASQLINVASLPGIVKYALAMPDIHEGYGFPIGGIAAINYEEGIISPGGIGFDQNCGMRILLSDYTKEDIEPYLEDIAKEIQQEVPSGLGRGRKIKLSVKQIEEILEGGAESLVKKGLGEKEDLENCEEGGRFKSADKNLVSNLAKERGRDQIGTLGSGNHFIEIQEVINIFDKKTAECFGLFENQVIFMIHTGSRALGHQIATDYLNLMKKIMPKYKIHTEDKELACVPFPSKEGQNFFRAMACGANYAFANRQMISYFIRKSLRKILGPKTKLKLLYDVAHNIAKIENHNIEIRGKKQLVKLIVHRKGATRAFPPQHNEIPEKYRKCGQPVLIPGSMGTFSYILCGTEKAKETFYSVSHGSGRKMSRKKAIQSFSSHKILEELKNKNIIVKYSSLRGITEEAPGAYKNIENVVNILDKEGISKKIAKLKPLAVIKGE